MPFTNVASPIKNASIAVGQSRRSPVAPQPEGFQKSVIHSLYSSISLTRVAPTTAVRLYSRRPD